MPESRLARTRRLYVRVDRAADLVPRVVDPAHPDRTIDLRLNLVSRCVIDVPPGHERRWARIDGISE